jgi:nucleotide-binding universal stress UspA family protein
MKFKRILLPTDFSAFSLEAAGAAKSLSEMSGAKVFLVHVMHPDPLMGIKNLHLTSAEVIREIEEDAMARMQKVMAKYFRGFPDVEPRLLSGAAYQALLRFIELEKIDLVVMATHGRSELSQILLGSVAERMVRHSPVPVLTVRPGALRH